MNTTPTSGADDAPDVRYRRIAIEAEQGGLVFSTHAQAGLRIKRALDDPDCSVDQAARLVQAEPLLAARIVAVANSVAYNPSGQPITAVRQAVSRLGFRTLRSLSMSMLVREMSDQPGDSKHQALVRQLWEHTAHVSALAHVIARRVTHQDPETALLAGILHEVAGFYLLARDMPEIDAGDSPDWQNTGEMIVGSALLKILEVPETIATAIGDMWQGYLAIPPTSLGDTLLLAEELAPVPSPLYWTPEKIAGCETGTPHIEMLLDQETLSSILAESAREVQSLFSALN